MLTSKYIKSNNLVFGENHDTSAILVLMDRPICYQPIQVIMSQAPWVASAQTPNIQIFFRIFVDLVSEEVGAKQQIQTWFSQEIMCRTPSQLIISIWLGYLLDFVQVEIQNLRRSIYSSVAKLAAITPD